MASDAARLEAFGDPEARLEFRGHTVIIARAVENWPLDAIRTAAAETLPGRPLMYAVDALLAGQDVGRLACIDDYVELSHRMADTVGVSPLPETPVRPADSFGGVPTLLDVLDNNADDVASDLRRFWGVDYADRWRGALTLREIWTYIRRMPAESATARARNGGKEIWTLQHHVSAAVYEFFARKMYPGRPATEAEVARWKEATRKAAEKEAKLRASAQRYAPATPALAAADVARKNRLEEMARNGEGGRTT
jgi:hypothetical protein